jgi:undecaprenyl-diphosphatase
MGMSLWEAFILGIIQGLTEFLPVSSSGHLEIGKAFFGGMGNVEESLRMTVVLHFATALSTLVVFRKDVMDLIIGVFKGDKVQIKFVLLIVLSMIPAVVLFLSLESYFEVFFEGKLLFVGLFLLVTAGLLLMADRAKSSPRDVNTKEAVLIGLAQAIAILPGISRSGSTIATSVILGIDREKAARFSFLMVVPLILGKMAKDMISGDFNGTESDGFWVLLVGFAAAFVTGLFACKWMIGLVKNAKLIYFTIYCGIVGALAIVYSLIGASL